MTSIEVKLNNALKALFQEDLEVANESSVSMVDMISEFGIEEEIFEGIGGDIEVQLSDNTIAVIETEGDVFILHSEKPEIVEKLNSVSINEQTYSLLNYTNLICEGSVDNEEGTLYGLLRAQSTTGNGSKIEFINYGRIITLIFNGNSPWSIPVGTRVETVKNVKIFSPEFMSNISREKYILHSRDEDLIREDKDYSVPLFDRVCPSGHPLGPVYVGGKKVKSLKRIRKSSKKSKGVKSKKIRRGKNKKVKVKRTTKKIGKRK